MEELLARPRPSGSRRTSRASPRGAGRAEGPARGRGASSSGSTRTSRHPQALAAHGRCRGSTRGSGSPKRTQDLLTLYRLFQGPIATTLDNKREPFLPVTRADAGAQRVPGGAHARGARRLPGRAPGRSATSSCTRAPWCAARRAANLARDLAALGATPRCSCCTRGSRARLKALAARPDPKVLYAVPYPVAYADDAGARLRPADARGGHGAAERRGVRAATCATARATCCPTTTRAATRRG